jgi:DNA damage-inducible protein 1
MQITVTTLTEYTFVLNVADDLELENFKAFCEVESGFPAAEIIIVFNGQPLMDLKKTLKDYGIREGDVVILQHVAAAVAAQRGAGEFSLFFLRCFAKPCYLPCNL